VPLKLVGNRVSETAPTLPMQQTKIQADKKARRGIDLINLEAFGCISFNISQLCI
jgi:hypothetical protein